MRQKNDLEVLMNIIILSSLVWLFADPEINFTVTKIHLILTALFIAYKLFKK